MSFDKSILESTIKPSVDQQEEATIDEPGARAYEDRVVAFIDILGFKDIIERTHTNGDDNPDEIGRVYDALSFKTESLRNAYESIFSSEDKETSECINSFSDCIVISVKNKESFELGFLIYSVYLICRQFLEYGFASRGGIACGKLVHEPRNGDAGGVVFGPAMVDAYEFESIHADTPRVMIQKNVSDKIQNYISNHPPKTDKLSAFLQTHVKKALDGPYCIDLFADFSTGASYADALIKDEMISKIKERIEIMLDDTEDRPKLFKKNIFLAKEFNSALTEEQKAKFEIKEPHFPSSIPS